MAFTVQQAIPLPAASVEAFFSLQKAWPMMVIRDWPWDLINYYHVQQLDIFGQGMEQVPAPNATAWMA